MTTTRTTPTTRSTRNGSATVTLPSDTEILITRSFDAPRALVWDALTTPRHLLRWWGPHEWPLVTCEIDLRPGGAWRYVARNVEGVELAWNGQYRSVTKPTQIVSSEVFEGFPDAESLNTMTLAEADGVTTLQTLVRHASKANRDGHVDSGMEGGMQETFNRLETLLSAAGTPAERFRRVAGRFGDRVDAVTPDGWNNAAPCVGWTAHDVVKHLVEWVPAVIGRSGIAFTGNGFDAAAPGRAWHELAEQLQQALDDTSVAAGTFDVGPPGEMTVANAIDMLVTGDVLIHTWDLARATGQDESLDSVVAEEMLVGMEPMDEMLRSSGHYGPRISVAHDADTQTKLIAFTGRNPEWRAGA